MSSEFVMALKSRDKRAIRETPKGNMHSHAGKGCSVEYLERRLGIEIPPAQTPFHSLKQMHHWYTKHIGKYCSSLAGMLMRWEGCFVEAAKDGIEVMVQSFSTKAIEDVGGIGVFASILESYRTQYCPDILFLPELTFSRDFDVEHGLIQLKNILPSGYFKSVDICFDETACPVDRFVPIYRECAKHGLVLKAHVGEFGTPEDVAVAVETLDLKEVHHGIALCTSKELMEWAKQRQLVLNICPSSNVQMGLVRSMRAHPIRTLYEAGVPVTICTDDLLIFQSSLSTEYERLYLCFGG